MIHGLILTARLAEESLDPSTIDKQEILKLLRSKLEADLRNVTTSQNAAQAGATHAETRQEDPKDTRAIEATYLARGLTEQVERMRDAVTIFSRLEVADFGPDAVVISLGVDTFEKDPISFFKLASDDFRIYGETIGGLGRPTLFVLEGGYAVAEIGVNAVGVLTGFEEA